MFPTVIRTREDFESIRDEINNTISYVVPIWADTKAHPAVNTPSVLFIYLKNQWSIYSVNHNEAPSLPTEWLDELVPYEMHTPFKRDLLYIIKNGCIVDCAEAEYIKNEEVLLPIQPPAVEEMHRKYSGIKNINKAVSIMKLLEWAEMIRIEWSMGDKNGFLSKIAIPVYQYIESSGMKIDLTKCKDKTLASNVVNGFAYGQYNPYHITGRPSNAFGGMNYAAIPKNTGEREAFVSRFDGGKLVLMDYESYHLRLIANMINFPQPKEPFHEYLGKIYFEKDTLTEEEYKAGKQLTFEYIYGSTSKPNIPFFQEMDRWLKEFYEEAQKTGQLSMRHRRIPLASIEEPTISKVFNYRMQSEEMTLTVSKLYELMNILIDRKAKSKIIMYIYDSILIDYCPEDGPELLQVIANCLYHQPSTTGFPVRIYVGPDYHNLKLIS